ncbi:hypothetical protein ASPBRDRAFT_48896 [Aspergillus brasiliensis CBS 101740]|uniref:Secreted protein n=1 Tax=Aspergillus brasiliensis (strain CBS 101740 / IMI 381727 / IBT 21946) TaxID=767769 RepID=A0A1L9U4J7_ASPBC|nr:hypothetical protein ASPBRDRAFT_48896 [Aspergillus brasiliensis CBS 101740]
MAVLMDYCLFFLSFLSSNRGLIAPKKLSTTINDQPDRRPGQTGSAWTCGKSSMKGKMAPTNAPQTHGSWSS